MKSGTRLALVGLLLELYAPSAGAAPYRSARFEHNVGQLARHVAFVGHAPGYRMYVEPGGRAAYDLGGTGNGSIIRMEALASRKLLLDPMVEFSSYLGGGSYDVVNAVAVDPSGALYLTGETASTDFPGAANSRRNRDAFVAKLSSNGAKLLYAVVLSGRGYNSGRAIKVDPSGNVVVAGVTQGGGFPVTSGAAQSSYGGLEDAFVAKLGPAGNLLYATYLGGPSTDVATGIDVDNSGSVYVTGYTASFAFPTTAGAARATYTGGFYDAFVTKLDAAGSLVYSTLAGGSGNDTASGIAVRADGSACIAGETSSDNLPVVQAIQSRRRGGTDAFAGCLNAPGTAWQQLTYVGGVSTDHVSAIAVDRSGAIYIAGWTASPDFPASASAFQAANRGDYDAFAIKMDAAGTLSYATLIGGAASDTATAIAVDAAGRAWLSGFTNSMDFPKAGPWQTGPKGGFDAFLCTVTGNGSAMDFSAYLGGSLDDRGLGIVLAGPASAIIAGMTSSADFPVTSGSFQASTSRSYDGFFAKITLESTPVPGDFDSNGHTDLVWQNNTTRQASVHYFDLSQGVGSTGSTWLYSNSNPGWSIVGIADFNADGKPDIVWQNDATRQVTINYFGGSQGATYLGWNWLYSSSNPGWSIVGVADFNADGKPDVVWQNDTTRQATVNYFGGSQGVTNVGWNSLYGNPNPGWRIVAVADFDGDGKPDVLWQNDATRQATVNFFGGTQGITYRGWAWLYSNSVPGWHIAGAADLSGDGKPDIIWQNDTTGQVTVNYFGGTQGTTYLGWDSIYTGPVAGWRLIVP